MSCLQADVACAAQPATHHVLNAYDSVHIFWHILSQRRDGYGRRLQLVMALINGTAGVALGLSLRSV